MYCMHFIVCIVTINNRWKKHPDDKQQRNEMMYVSRVRTKHCDWATENRRQLDLCGFMFVRAKNIVCHGQLKTQDQIV